jgi:hypothetical protein
MLPHCGGIINVMKDNRISLFINVFIQCTLDLIIKGIFFLFREILNEFAAKTYEVCEKI